MPARNIVFANNEIYHIYNRSIAGEQIFTSQIHLRKVLELFEYYRKPQRLSLSKFKKLPKGIRNDYLLESEGKPAMVEINAFAIMPNHYHLLVKQLSDNGVSRFVSNFQNSYAKYYNLKKNRDGSLFKNQFKGKWIESDEQFLHVSRYIHLNPVTAYIIPFDKLETYRWTSFPYYLRKDTGTFVHTAQILNMFNSVSSFKEFVAKQSDYQRGLAKIKHLIFD